MTPEQKAALDRLRKHEAITGMDFRESPYFVEGRGVDEFKRLLDLFVLKDAYLAEHPADDDEPVTEEWLRSVFGGKPTGVIGWNFSVYFYATQSPELIYEYGQEADYFYQYGNASLPECKTRGDVRRLCMDLGIQLNEPTSAPPPAG